MEKLKFPKIRFSFNKHKDFNLKIKINKMKKEKTRKLNLSVLFGINLGGVILAICYNITKFGGYSCGKNYFRIKETFIE